MERTIFGHMTSTRKPQIKQYRLTFSHLICRCYRYFVSNKHKNSNKDNLRWKSFALIFDLNGDIINHPASVMRKRLWTEHSCCINANSNFHVIAYWSLSEPHRMYSWICDRQKTLGSTSNMQTKVNARFQTHTISMLNWEITFIK